jgi:peptide/nickel transport system substrate-binding protein
MLRKTFLFLVIITVLILSASCTRTNNGAVTIANSEAFSTLDTITVATSTAADDRIRSLIHNALVKKNEKFEYVGDLANEIKIGDDGLTITFNLRENVKFHTGKIFNSADAKYTIDTLM